MKKFYPLFLIIAFIIGATHPVLSGSFLQTPKNPFAKQIEKQKAKAAHVKTDEIPSLLQDLNITEIMVTENGFDSKIDFSLGQNGAEWNGAKVLAYKFTLTELQNLTISSTNFVYQENNYGYAGLRIYNQSGGYSTFYLNDLSQNTVKLSAGIYYMSIDDNSYFSNYGTSFSFDLSISKTTVQVTPITFPFSSTISFTDDNQKIYSFSLSDTFSYLKVNLSSLGSTNYSICDEDFNNIEGNYLNEEGSIEKSHILSSGNYFLVINGIRDNPVTLNLTTEQPETISVPFDGDLTIDKDKAQSEVFLFTLTSEGLIDISLGENSYSTFYDNQGNVYYSNLFEAGTYYLKINKYSQETNTVHLTISVISTENAHTYTDINYSAPLSKGSLVTGNLNVQNNLTYVDINGFDTNDDDIINDEDNTRSYMLACGYTLQVESGKIYHFSSLNNSSDEGYTQFYLLKGDTLSGNFINDLDYLPISEDETDYVPTENGSVRVFVIVFDSFQDVAYSLRVTESGTSSQVLTLPELFENHSTEITYDNSLSYAQIATIDPATSPLVNMNILQDSEIPFKITAHAIAYKIILPENNAGLNGDMSADIMPYLKQGDEYIPILEDDEETDNPEYVKNKTRKIKSAAFPAGEYYLLCVGEEPILTEPFTFYIKLWTDNVAEPETPVISGLEVITIKELLDNSGNITTIASLPFAEAGMITKSQPCVDIHGWGGSEGFYTKAFKFNKTEEGYINLNINGYIGCEVYVADGEGGYSNYNQFGYNTGEYYLVIYNQNDNNDENYMIRLWANEDLMPEIDVMHVNANVTNIDVPVGANLQETLLYLAEIKLTGTLNIGGTVTLTNASKLWDIATDGSSATFISENANQYNYNYSFDAAITPLTVTINRISGTEQVNSKMWMYSFDGKIYINDADTDAQMLVTDISGKRVYVGKVSASREEIPVPQKGIYIVKIGGTVAKVFVNKN